MIGLSGKPGITTRIYGSYLLLASIIIGLTVSTYIGLNRIESEFMALQSLGQSRESGINLGKTANAIQRAVEFYIETGNPSDAENVRDLYQQASNDIQILKEQNLDLAKDLVPRLQQHLDNLNQTFAQVQSQRLSTSSVVDVRITRLLQGLDSKLQKLLAFKPTGNSLIGINEIWRNIVLIEKHMAKYFAELNYENVTEVERLTEAIFEKLIDLGLFEPVSDAEQPIELEHVEQMTNDLNLLITAFNEAVQRVRGYQFLVNVVIAADSYEVGYLAERLSKSLQELSYNYQQESIDLSRSLERQHVLFGTFLVLISILISYLVGRSIVKPVSYLRSTFDRLSQGEKNLQIARFETQDEIAALANSAEAFRLLNVETQQLLHKYQILSENLEQKVQQRTEQLEQANTQLEKLSLTDSLTGLNNRRSFEHAIIDRWSRAQRSAEPISIIMIDIDHFKAYNDTYGHIEGDECLRKVAETLKEVFSRQTDFTARYGGEEFVVVLEATTENSAYQIAENARIALFDKKIEHSGSPLKVVSLSIGVASIVPEESYNDPQSLVEKADKALYQSKQNGRNRVTCYEQSLQFPS